MRVTIGWQAPETLWPYTGELFIPAPYEQELGIDLAALQVSMESKNSKRTGRSDTGYT